MRAEGGQEIHKYYDTAAAGRVCERVSGTLHEFISFKVCTWALACVEMTALSQSPGPGPGRAL
jgi:hypothetical protein